LEVNDLPKSLLCYEINLGQKSDTMTIFQTTSITLKESPSMRTILINLVLLLFSLQLAFGQPVQDRKFYQDMSIHYSSKTGLTDQKAHGIRIENGSPVAIFDDATFRFDGSKWSPVKHVKTAVTGLNLPVGLKGEVLSAVQFGNGYAAGTADGLFLYTEAQQTWQPVYPKDENYKWAPYNVSALVTDSRGWLWFGAEQGVGCFNGSEWKLYSGKEGLPYNKFTCAAAGDDGIVWFGTEKGAIRLENGMFHYRFSLRWLPDDHVNAIAIGEDGTAWLATNKGVGKIARQPMTFREKAQLFTRQTEERNQRMGFISPNRLKTPYDKNSFEPGISDNDGKYTSMYGAAHAFRYAITGEQEAKQLAVRSFEACKWLVDITHEPGFPARVIVPAGWPEPLADPEYSHQMNLRVQQNDPFWKDINPRFVKSKDGKYLWKCDTSSDELAGHYFFYAIYYDLVAKTEEEKAPVREVVAAITDHLIRNDFFLRDFDGKSTRWGNFSPEFFNSIWGWDQRGLNSLMMLSFLNVATHVTGDQKYAGVAAMLRDKHHYHINAMHGKEFFPPSNVVPWDNNLCLMSMYGLMNYETDPELMIMYRISLENSWLHISKQQNAFWDAIYLALANRFTKLSSQGFFNSDKIFPIAGSFTQKAVSELNQLPDLKSGIMQTLRLLPIDLIGYSMDNTHRLDIEIDPTPGQSPDVGWKVGGFALPIDERGHIRQDRDGFSLTLTEGGGGSSESEGTFFLLPYYMALYHQLID
jgi:hypothetical protein